MKAKMWYPLLAPSVEGLAPSDADSTHQMKRSKWRRPNLWIRRCRVAAMVSGIVAFVVVMHLGVYAPVHSRGSLLMVRCLRTGLSDVHNR